MTKNPLLRVLDEGHCRLCGDESDLQLSHIIPAFIFRELKRGSGTGHIRFSETPNVRVQDGAKEYWLCAPCEQLLSAWERKFANDVMRPWTQGTHKTHYGDWMLKFCVSVSWRILLFAKGRNQEATYSVEEEGLFERCELAWREFLLGARPHPGAFEQHFLIGDVIGETSVPDLPKNFNRFMTGSVMLDIVGSDRCTYTWAKLGQFQIFGTVNHGPNKWEGTKIHVKHGELAGGRFVVPHGILDLWKEKAAVQSDAFQNMSANQKDKVETFALANIDHFRNSRTFRAMQADAEMFGKDAVIRQDKT